MICHFCSACACGRAGATSGMMALPWSRALVSGYLVFLFGLVPFSLQQAQHMQIILQQSHVVWAFSERRALWREDNTRVAGMDQLPCCLVAMNLFIFRDTRLGT